MGDVTSGPIFEDILSDEEAHIDYLETQIGLVSQLGEQLYLAQLVKHITLHQTTARSSARVIL